MTDTPQTSEADTVPFYPDHVRTELRVVIGVSSIVILIGIIGLLSPIGLGQPADPMDTPAHIKPEWYFLALYQLLKYIDKTFGATLPVIALGLLVLWPFLDRNPDKSTKAKRIRFIVVTLGVILLVIMTIWGEVS